MINRLPGRDARPRRRNAWLFFGLMLGGAWCGPLASRSEAPRIISATEAVPLAATAGPDGVAGIFELTVQSTGQGDGNTYLDSEMDYRSPTNLAIALTTRAADDFRAKFGDQPAQMLKGKTLRVSGHARRVRIDYAAKGRPTGAFYFQTRVPVDDFRQIEILSPRHLPPPRPEIEIGKVSLAEVHRLLPNNPEYAEYLFRLQQQIDRTCFEELRAEHFGGVGAAGRGHGLVLTLTVLADGRIGADRDELKIREGQEPILTAAVVKALAQITEAPEPFSPVLKKEVGSSFTFSVHFSLWR